MQEQIGHIVFNRRLLLSAVLCLFFFILFKAQTSKVYAVGGSYLTGSSLSINSKREFGSSKPVGLEIFFQRYRDGSKYWEKLYNYPQTGWALSWIDHRNKTLGSSFALNRYLNFVFLRREHLEFYLRAAQGIMVATDIYDSGSENKTKFNNAISQNINFSEQGGLGLNIYPIKNLSINLAGTFTHFSNGAISQPNDGLNMLMLHLGLSYRTQGISNTFYKQPEKPEDDRKVKYTICMGGGVKQITADNRNKYPLLTTSFYVDKKLSRMNALNIGVDIFLNSAVKHSIDNDPSYKGTDFKRIGISAGHEFFIDKVGVLTQIGYHVYAPYPALSNFYEKFGMKYYFSDKLFATFTVKLINLEISDETSWGLGLRL